MWPTASTFRRDIEFNTRIKKAVFDSNDQHLDGNDRQRQRRNRAILHHGDGQSLDAAQAELPRVGELQGQVVSHGLMAA